jgi:hypothetical protein
VAFHFPFSLNALLPPGLLQSFVSAGLWDRPGQTPSSVSSSSWRLHAAGAKFPSYAGGSTGTGRSTMAKADDALMYSLYVIPVTFLLSACLYVGDHGV